jgi:hypothetical protein
VTARLAIRTEKSTTFWVGFMKATCIACSMRPWYGGWDWEHSLNGLPSDLGHDGTLSPEVLKGQAQEVVNHKCCHGEGTKSLTYIPVHYDGMLFTTLILGFASGGHFQKQQFSVTGQSV